MSSRPGRLTGLPCVLVVVDDHHPCDPIGLLDALGPTLPAITVGAWFPAAAPDPAVIRHSATLLDELEHWCGQRPRYEELVGPLRSAVVDWILAADGTTIELLVVVGQRTRGIRPLRRVVRDRGARLAVAPAHTGRTGLVIS